MNCHETDKENFWQILSAQLNAAQYHPQILQLWDQDGNEYGMKWQGIYPRNEAIQNCHWLDLKYFFKERNGRRPLTPQEYRMILLGFRRLVSEARLLAAASCSIAFILSWNISTSQQTTLYWQVQGPGVAYMHQHACKLESQNDWMLSECLLPIL